MATSIPPRSKPYPNTVDLSSEEFDDAMNRWFEEQPAREEAMNLLAEEVEGYALNAEAAAGAIANQAWVSGTTYSAGAVRYSPADFLNYRRKTNGAGTTDPSLDPTNWALLTKTVPGGAETTNGSSDIALTATSGRLQVVSMTASGKKVTLPAATGVSKGSPVFVIKNSGNYRFAVRKNGGAFICMIRPGQTLSFGCSDNTTSAGVWTVSGGDIMNIFDGNTPEVLNSVDSRDISVAMLSATKAICCFKNNSTTFLNAVILNFGSASGSVSVISAEAVRSVRVVALSATKAVVVYKLTGSNSSVKGYVLDISGNTITPGSVQTINTQATSGGDGMGLTVLSSSQLLVAYSRGAATAIQEKILDVSGTTITASAEASVDTTGINGLTVQVGALSPTKALVLFSNDQQRTTMRHQTISGSTPSAAGSALTLIPPGPAQLFNIYLCVLSSSRALVVRSISSGGFIAYLINTAGTSPVLAATKHINADYLTTSPHIYGAKLDANHVYLAWPGGYGGVDAVIITITHEDRILLGEQFDSIEQGVASDTFGYLACDALDSTHVMQVCRNASTFLSAKTIEVST